MGLSKRSIWRCDRLKRREFAVHKISRASFRVAIDLVASLVLAVMVGAGVILGQFAVAYLAAIDRFSTGRASSDYDNLDLYRMLEVGGGSEDRRLLY